MGPIADFGVDSYLFAIVFPWSNASLVSHLDLSHQAAMQYWSWGIDK